MAHEHSEIFGAHIRNVADLPWPVSDHHRVVLKTGMGLDEMV